MAQELTMEEIMGAEDAQEITSAQEQGQETPPEPQEGEKPEEGTPEPPEVPEGEAATEGQQQKVVPLPALQEARAEIKALREKAVLAERLKEEFERFRADYYQRQQQLPQQQQQEMPKIPDFNEDPIGHLQARLELQQNALKQMIGAEVQRQQQGQTQEQVVQFGGQVMMEVDEFKKTVPDYMDAYNYVRDLRMKELQALGVTNPIEVQRHIDNSSANLIYAAKQNGINPGQALYNLAKSYGYQTKPAVNAGDLNTVQQGISQASGSIGKGGGTPSADPTFDALLNANNPDDFSKMWNKIFSKQINR